MTGSPCPPSLRALVRGHQRPELQVDCPHCQAPAGQPCHGPSGRRLSHAHGSRCEAAGVTPAVETGRTVNDRQPGARVVADQAGRRAS